MITTALCFDLFDTLIAFDESVYRACRQPIEDLILLPFNRFNAVWNASKSPSLEADFQTIDERVEYVLRQFGLKSNTLTEDVSAIEKSALYKACSCIDGVNAILEWGVSHGLSLGILSNASAAGEYLLNAMALDHYFKAIVFSFKDRVRKPESEAFQLVCSRLRSSPGRTAYIADGSSGELEGADKAGLHVIRFDPLLIHRDQPPIRFPDFDQSETLLNYLKKSQKLLRIDH